MFELCICFDVYILFMFLYAILACISVLFKTFALVVIIVATSYYILSPNLA
jgi:hypothetical protein